MGSGGRSGGGVSEQRRRIDHSQERGRGRSMRRVASMTSVNLLDRMSELSDRVIRPFNASREGRRGSISEIPTYILSFHGAPRAGLSLGSQSRPGGYR